MSKSRGAVGRRGVLAGAASAAAAVTANLPFAAFARAAAQADAPHDFHVISQVYNLRNVYWSNWQKGAAEAGAALKMHLQVEVDDQNNDKLQTIFRTAKSRGFAGITSCVADPGITPSILRMAQSEGVYVANGWNLEAWLTPFEIGDYYTSFSTPNDVAGARALARLLFNHMGGHGDIIHVAGIPGSTVAINRADRSRSRVEGVPPASAWWRASRAATTRGKTIPVINAMLVAHPTAKAVFCQNDDTAMGVIAALQSRGRHDVLVTGIDGIPEFLDAIADGPRVRDLGASRRLHGCARDAAGVRRARRRQAAAHRAHDVYRRLPARHRRRRPGLQAHEVRHRRSAVRFPADVARAAPRRLGSAEHVGADELRGILRAPAAQARRIT